MRTQIKKGPLFLIYFLFISFSVLDINPSYAQIPSSNENSDLLQKQITSLFTDHERISLNGNVQFHNWVAIEGWSGDGTAQNPYIIERISITDSSQHIILINNTSIYFQIKDCILQGGSDYSFFGIYFHNVSHGSVVNTTVSNCRTGIFIEKSDFCNIIQTTLTSNGMLTEYLRTLSNIEEKWLWNQIDANGMERCGLYLCNTHNCTIKKNLIFSNGLFGVFYESSSANKFIENAVTQSNNYYACIGVSGHRSNVLGISTKGGISEKNEFRNNTLKLAAFYLYEGARDNLIIYNHLIRSCLILIGGDENTILNNLIQRADMGIKVLTMFFSNLIPVKTQKNLIQNNLIFNCVNGIWLNPFAEKMHIINNTICNNKKEGIVLLPRSWYSPKYNIIKGNDFIRNNAGGIQASDYGDNNTFESNFWSDWTGSDINNDSYLDEPYSFIHNKDPMPTKNPNQKHIHQYSPIVVYPNGGEIINQTISLEWLPALDIYDHEIKYTVFYSHNGGEWRKIVNGLVTTSTTWNTSVLSDGNYSIKIVATCVDGIKTEDTSDKFFFVNNDLETSDKSTYGFLWLILPSSFVLIIFWKRGKILR